MCFATNLQISGNRWLYSVMWHMKGSELPALIASHFGKILPVLPVNSNILFLWKILHSAIHNVTDCCFLWTSYSNSHCIISSAVLMRKKCNYISPIILFFPQNFLYYIMYCASWMVSGVEVPLSGENCFFSMICCSCRMGVCLRAASAHLRGFIKPPGWLLSGGKLSGVRC